MTVWALALRERARRWLRRVFFGLLGRCECGALLVYGYWSAYGGFEDSKGCVNTKCERFHPYWGWDGKR